MWNSATWKLLFQPHMQHWILHGWVSAYSVRTTTFLYLHTHLPNMLLLVERGSVHSNLQACFLSCSGFSQVSVPQNPLPGPASPPPLWREHLLYAVNGAFSDHEGNYFKPSILVVYSGFIAQCAEWCILIFFFSICFRKLCQEPENLNSRNLP